MRQKYCLITALTCWLIFHCASLIAQNQSPEFIESSSPLPGGGRVVSRSTPGSGIQTTTYGPGQRSRATRPNLNSVLHPKSTEPNRRSSFFQASSDIRTNASQSNTNQRYPYPGARMVPTSFRVAQARTVYPPVRATATCTNCQIPYQIPTLGLANSVTARRANQGVAPSNCCSPQNYPPAIGLQVQGYQAPVLQIQPPASQVPSLATQASNQAAQFSSGTFQPPALTRTPGIGVPQFGAQQNSRSQLAPGFGAYQPIIRLANVPPGTYIGQGIIGQPKAYVDGQPVRNLMRYVFP